MPEIPAVVVGLCTHGLATVRALSRFGVVVHALEANARLPGVRTGRAHVHLVDEVNGPGLIRALIEARERIASREPPPLFLMNDNMVREVSSNWPELQRHYRLSWDHCVDDVRRLQRKSELADRCVATGLGYPRSAVVRGEADLRDLGSTFDGPLIVKPVRPLSRFKVKRLLDRAELRNVIAEFESDLPFLVQDWIPGGDESLVFCAMYLDRGRVVSHYVGRKLRSHPPALGGTSMAISHSDPAILPIAERFFDGLGMSGPVSLELKRDESGAWWVIEPTVGRTDFWLECCIANGVDFPTIEYCHTTGLPMPHSRQSRVRVWIETEMDPGAILWYLFSPRGWMRIRLPIVFPYLRRDDVAPFLAALRECARRFVVRIASRLRRTLGIRLKPRPAHR